MTTDLAGYRLSTDSAEAARSWDRMHLRFLAHGADTPDHLAAATAADPDLAVAHAVKGLFLGLLGRRELVETAQAALVAARAARADTPRERLYVEALGDWLDGRPGVAAARLDRITQDWPQDTLAAKIAHAIYFVLGDARAMRGSIEAVLGKLAPDHPARGYMLGCHAFALEETGAYKIAEARGRAGLELAPDDAWGLHAVAHVCDMTGRAADGLVWLDGREAAWMHCNNFRFHVWWHKALMYLDLGQTDAALALYDDAVRCERTDDYRDIANAASLLCRLDLEGVDTGDRWDELAALAAARTDDGCLIFADLHYLLALVGGDRSEATARLVRRIARDGARPDCETRARMADPGIATARGLEAFGAGDYATAFALLRAAGPTMQRAGGSHAQRDVFERLTIDSAIRAGLFDTAADLVAERTARRGGFEDGYAAARRALVARQARRAAG